MAHEQVALQRMRELAAGGGRQKQLVNAGFVASRFSLSDMGEILLLSFVLAWFVFSSAIRRAGRIESIHWHERVRMDARREYNAELRRK